MWHFWLFAKLNLTKIKNINFNREKVFEKVWKSACMGFGCADHNALCKNFVWQVLSELSWFSPEILIFQELLIIETQNQCHWIWHTLNPIYVPLKPFWCIFPSQNQQKYENFLAVLLNSPNKKFKKMSILTGEKVFKKAWKSAHVGFWVCQLQCTTLETFVWQVLFWLMMVFLYFWQEGLVPVMPFQYIFPSQNQQNVKFLKLNFILKLILNLTLILKLKLNLILNLTMNVILKLNLKLILKLNLILNLILKLNLKLILKLKLDIENW